MTCRLQCGFQSSSSKTHWNRLHHSSFHFDVRFSMERCTDHRTTMRNKPNLTEKFLQLKSDRVKKKWIRLLELIHLVLDMNRRVLGTQYLSMDLRHVGILFSLVFKFMTNSKFLFQPAPFQEQKDPSQANSINNQIFCRDKILRHFDARNLATELN